MDSRRSGEKAALRLDFARLCALVGYADNLRIRLPPLKLLRLAVGGSRLRRQPAIPRSVAWLASWRQIPLEGAVVVEERISERVFTIGGFYV